MLGLKAYWKDWLPTLGLGSSKEEEPCRVWYLLGKDPASWEALSWGDTCWGRALSHWETSLTSLEEFACLPNPKPCQAPDWLRRYRPLCLESTILWGRGETALGELTLCLESVFFWGSLRIVCMGEHTLWYSAIFWGSLGTACLGTTCLGTACLGEPTACKSAISWEGLGAACLEEHTACQSAVCWGSLGTACLEEHTACRSAVCWGSWVTACLGEHTACLRKSAIYQGSLGTACLGQHFLRLHFSHPCRFWACSVSLPLPI